MKRMTGILSVVFAAGLATASAQPPGGRGGPRGPGRGPMPIIEALDADHDHIISAEEIKNATALLLSLDKNNDGMLKENEFAGDRGEPGPGRGPDGPGDGRSGRRPMEGRGRPGGPGRGDHDGPPPPPNPERMIEHAMEFDADKDGKLSREELAKFVNEFTQHQPHHNGPPRGDGSGRPGSIPRDENDRPDQPRRPD